MKLENKHHGVLDEVSKELRLHETECKFYTELSSTVNVRIARFGILPQCGAIILEDLSKYARAPSFSSESGMKVISCAANLHAHFRGSPLTYFSQHSKYFGNFVKCTYPLFREKWGGRILPSTLTLLDHAVDSFSKAEKYLLSVPQTLLHGDLKFPNIFWDEHSNGEPIFIYWQYAGPGHGIEDIIFLLIESSSKVDFSNLARILIDAYFDKLQQVEGDKYTQHQRELLVCCALAGFPLFVAVWFGTIDASRLTNKNFPFLYIMRLMNAFDILYKPDTLSRSMSTWN